MLHSATGGNLLPPSTNTKAEGRLKIKINCKIFQVLIEGIYCNQKEPVKVNCFLVDKKKKVLL